MTRELLAEIIDKRLFLDLFFIVTAYFLCWYMVLKLGFLILGQRANFRQLYPMILIGSLYSFWSKQLIPLALVGILLPVVTAFLIWLVDRRLNPIKCFWVGLITTLCGIAGDLIIQTPICAVSSKAAYFLLKTTWGYVVGTGCETVFPVLALIILPKLLPRLKVPLIPPVGPKLDRLDITVIITYFAMYSANYLASITIFISLLNNYRHLLLFLIIQCVFTIIIVFGHYRFVNAMQKKFELEKTILNDRIIHLEQEKEDLATLNEQLEANKIEPQAAVDAMQMIIERLQNAVSSVITEQRSQLETVNETNPDPVHLTNRERQVLALVAQGLYNKEIAAELGISTGRARNIVRAMLQKTGLSGKTQLVIYAVQNKLVDIDTIKFDTIKDEEEED